MLEQQIETLVCRIETLAGQTQTTNNILTDILVEIRANGLPPAHVLAAAVGHSEPAIAAVPSPDPTPEPQDTPDAPVSLSDARDALIKCAETCGSDVAREVVARLAAKDRKPTLGNVPVGMFPAIIKACAAAIPSQAAA